MATYLPSCPYKSVISMEGEMTDLKYFLEQSILHNLLLLIGKLLPNRSRLSQTCEVTIS